MAESTKKATVKRVFGSLINNRCAIDGAKFSPWWVGLIMFVFGLLLPVLPIFVSAAKTEGTTFMKSCEYGLGLDKTFGVAISELDGALTFDNTEKTINYTANNTYNPDDSTLIGGYIATSGECNGQYELRVFYNSSTTTKDEINDYITMKEKIVYRKGTTLPCLSEEEGAYTPSSVYFFKNGFFVDIYASNSSTRKAYMTYVSDLHCLDYDGGDLKTYFVGGSFDKTNKDSRMAAFDKMKEFLNITYKTEKTRTMWLGSLLYFGIYAGVNVFMILMIFLMSRGKNNPNNYLTFWTCTKINWWESLCPGLLGMILGFIITRVNPVMIYVLLISMRTMWLTMREMRPVYQ